MTMSLAALPVGPAPAMRFSMSMGAAIDSMQRSLSNLSLPHNARPIIDPLIPVMAHARLALRELQRGIGVGEHVQQDAFDAAVHARSELLQAMATIENGHPSLVPARTHFSAALNWATIARNWVHLEG